MKTVLTKLSAYQKPRLVLVSFGAHGANESFSDGSASDFTQGEFSGHNQNSHIPDRGASDVGGDGHSQQ